MKKPSEHIAHSLKFIKSNRRLKDKLLVVEVKQHLVDLFGDIVTEYVTQVRVQDDKLHLYFNSSTLKHQLYHDKVRLMELIHEKIGYKAFTDVLVHG